MYSISDLNIILVILSTITIIYAVYRFRSYTKRKFYRWMLLSFIALGLWSVLIVLLDYTSSPISNGLVLNLFIMTPITVSICYFMMAYEFATQNKVPRLVLGVFILPLGLLVLGVINPWNIVFSFDSAFSTGIDSSAIPGDMINLRFIINAVIGYTLMLMSLGIITSKILQTKNYTRIYQGCIMSISIVMICVLAGLRIFQIMPYGIDMSVVAIDTVLVLYLLPETLNELFPSDDHSDKSDLNNINKPSIILNGEEEIIDMSSKAKGIVKRSGYSPKEIVNRNEVQYTKNDCERCYQVTKVPVENNLTEHESMYVLSDVSDMRDRIKDLKLAQKVSKRILRHNVKNKLTPIMGYAEMIDSDEYSDKIHKNAEDLADTSGKAILMHNSITSDTTVEANPVDMVKDVISDYDNQDIDMVYDLENVRVELPMDADIVLQECIDNSIDHNGDNVDIRFELEEDASNIKITYKDNGSGIPKDEIEVTNGLEETEMKHSTGCGIWMLKYVIESAGGKVNLSNDNGAVIEIFVNKVS